MTDYADVLGACMALGDRGLALVAIDGPGGAGKSTLARKLLTDLPSATIVHIDDFYRPMPEPERERLSPAEGYERSFDWERLRDEVLTPLRAGRTARFHPFDWNSDSISADEMSVEARGVVIIEGVNALRPQLQPFWDLSVFLEASRQVRLARMIARSENTPAQIRRWMEAEDYYAETFTPDERADIVVSDLTDLGVS